jgi:hypothetical protein
MSHTYKDVYDEIRSRRGYSEAESYRCEIERDGHSIHGYESVWSEQGAINGCRDYDNERRAAEAYRELEYQRRREEEREQEREREEMEQQHARQAAEEQRQMEEAYYAEVERDRQREEEKFE